MENHGKITDVYVEWDDPHAFRVFLVRDGDMDHAEPMSGAGHVERGSVEERLFRAAFVKTPKDFMDQPACEKSLGWPKKGPADRVLKAVRAELVRIDRGEPAVDDGTVSMAAQIAKILYSKKGRR